MKGRRTRLNGEPSGAYRITVTSRPRPATDNLQNCDEARVRKVALVNPSRVSAVILGEGHEERQTDVFFNNKNPADGGKIEASN